MCGQKQYIFSNQCPDLLQKNLSYRLILHILQQTKRFKRLSIYIFAALSRFNFLTCAFFCVLPISHTLNVWIRSQYYEIRAIHFSWSIASFLMAGSLISESICILDNRQNEKSHSSKISLRKVALNKRNLYFYFLPLGTAFCRFPYYSVLSGIIGSKFAVLFLSKAWKPWFYCIPSFKDFIVGTDLGYFYTPFHPAPLYSALIHLAFPDSLHPVPWCCLNMWYRVRQTQKDGCSMD